MLSKRLCRTSWGEMKVAFVHDWLVTYRGGERVLEALLELFPEAPVYTLFYDPKKMPKSISDRDIRVDPWLNRLRPLRKLLLPLLPSAIEAMPLEDYDLVISTSSCVAKGVMVGPETRHICYIHSPMRYVWDQRQYYLAPRRQFHPFEFIIHILSKKLRIWDILSNSRVDQFVANSAFVKKRVKRYYGRDAAVIHPPVDVDRFYRPEKSPVQGSYLLAAGAFVSYKRFDLAIDACERLGRKLVIAGSGPEEAKLRRLAGKNTEFIIKPTQDEWVGLFQGADAFLFPGVEDFGITAIEALAAGTPLIALKAGGALDFVIPRQTGVFFEKPQAEDLMQAIQGFRKDEFSKDVLREFARSFHKTVFLEKMRLEINELTRTEA